MNRTSRALATQITDLGNIQIALKRHKQMTIWAH